jgi:cyanophycinase-like exopeptidase
MESHQIIQENLKETKNIRQELCCIKDAIEETNELLGGGGGSDTSYVVDGYSSVILTGANATITFDDPVSCVEVKASNADSTTKITVVTTPALTAGNGFIFMNANDYETFCFDNAKIVSINLLNNSTTTVTYRINGING